MTRLAADAPPGLWVPVTGSLGFRGRRHRKAAIGMLLDQANRALGVPQRPGRGLFAWAVSQAAPLLIRRADGRVLVWVWRDDPKLLVAMAQLLPATAEVRTARASLPIEYDDTETFRNPHLGAGEKLAMPLPTDPRTPPFVTYTWDTGRFLVMLTSVCAERERFGTVVGSVDDLARSLRIVDDIAVDESSPVLRIDPS